MKIIITENQLETLMIRRRYETINKFVTFVLNNTYPCDYDSYEHFVSGVLYEINDIIGFYEADDLQNTTTEELNDFVVKYFDDKIRQYWGEGNC